MPDVTTDVFLPDTPTADDTRATVGRFTMRPASAVPTSEGHIGIGTPPLKRGELKPRHALVHYGSRFTESVSLGAVLTAVTMGAIPLDTVVSGFVRMGRAEELRATLDKLAPVKPAAPAAPAKPAK